MRRLRLRKRSLLALLAILFFAAAAVLAVRILSDWELKSQGTASVPGRISGVISCNGESFIERKALVTILVMGLDKFGVAEESGSYNNDEQCDFVALLIVDPNSEEVTLLHLNRDTMTDVPILGVYGDPAGTRYEQLALAHTYGTGMEDSCLNTVQATENLLLGIEIDHYISISMDAVARMNDLVGGVTVTMEEDLTQADPAFEQGAAVHLTGEQALRYTRARMGVSDGTNLARMSRQRTYLTAFVEQFRTACLADEELFYDIYTEISPYTVTDCAVDYLSGILDDVLQQSDFDIRYPEGEAVVSQEGYMEFYPDQNALFALLRSIFAR